MAKTKQMPHQSQPEPNPFLKGMQSMSTKTHLISTSNPVSPDEPQPVMEIRETSEQPSQAAPASDPQVVMIQPPPSGEDAGDTTEFKPGTASMEI